MSNDIYIMELYWLMGASDGDIERYLHEISEFKLLTADEEQKLATLIAKGDMDAREQMIRCNLRLVVSIAKQYTNQGFPLLDLIAEGNMGLLKAVECFRPGEGARFSTYGSWWIKQSIRGALKSKVKNVRVPAYMSDIVNRWRKVSQELTQDLERSATPDEIAARMRISPEKIALIQQAIVAGGSSSFGSGGDVFLSGEDSSDIEELLARAGKDVQPNTIFSGDQDKKLEIMLSCLDTREEQIIQMRYGLKNSRFYTLQEIGRKIKLTRERVRQIEGIALRKMIKMLGDE